MSSILKDESLIIEYRFFNGAKKKNGVEALLMQSAEYGEAVGISTDLAGFKAQLSVKIEENCKSDRGIIDVIQTLLEHASEAGFPS